MMNFKKTKAFTMIELLIAMCIIGILSMIAVPSYRNYVVQARRSDAQQELTKLVGALENCFALNNTYENCLGDDNTKVLPSNVSSYYNFNSEVTRNAYFISVTAKGSQTRDTTTCQQLTINSLGRKFSGCTTSGCVGQGADAGHCW